MVERKIKCLGRNLFNGYLCDSVLCNTETLLINIYDLGWRDSSAAESASCPPSEPEFGTQHPY